MKPLSVRTPARTQTPVRRREQLLAAFARSELTAAAFARHHGIAYTTFCSWRRRQATKVRPAFVQVEVLPPATPEPIVVEWGSRARLRLSSPGQLELVAGLLHRLEGAC
jgi:hypothetical protein